MQYHTTWPVIVLCLLLGAVSCTVPAQPRTGLARLDETEMERFLQYFARLRALSGEALQREYAQQEVAFVHRRGPADRLRLILLLSLPDTAFANPPYALELLQEYLHEPVQSQAQFRDIAVCLLTLIENTPPASEPRIKQLQEELHDKEGQLLAQQQLSKTLQTELEAQKSLVSHLSKQLQEALSGKERQLVAQQQLNRKLQDEKRNVRRLQEKIEKIKDIEKSFIEKEHTNDKGT